MAKHQITEDIIDKAYKAGAILRVCREALDEWPMEGNTCPLAGDIRLALEVVQDFSGDIHNALERSVQMLGAADA